MYVVYCSLNIAQYFIVIFCCISHLFSPLIQFRYTSSADPATVCKVTVYPLAGVLLPGQEAVNVNSHQHPEYVYFGISQLYIWYSYGNVAFPLPQKVFLGIYK